MIEKISEFYKGVGGSRERGGKFHDDIAEIKLIHYKSRIELDGKRFFCPCNGMSKKLFCQGGRVGALRDKTVIVHFEPNPEWFLVLQEFTILQLDSVGAFGGVVVGLIEIVFLSESIDEIAEDAKAVRV
jgi:hypothetical protein